MSIIDSVLTDVNIQGCCIGSALVVYEGAMVTMMVGVINRCIMVTSPYVDIPIALQ